MEAFSIKHQLFPSEMGIAWKKELPKGCHSRVACGISKRRLLLDSVGTGAVVMIEHPALSGPLQEPRRPESISDIKQMDSGVKFQDIIAGEGEAAKAGSRVEFNYVCRRSNGYFVFSTVDQFTGESNPVSLLLDENEIIEGLKEVLIGMKVGGKRRALVPPNVGYVNESLKPIPVWSSAEPSLPRE